VTPLCQPRFTHSEIASQLVVRLTASWRRHVAVAALAASLTGCAGAHIYNEAKDKMAQEASKQYQSADLLQVIKLERGNLAHDLQIELDVVQRHIDTVLRAEWFRLVDSSEPVKTSYFDKAIKAREAELGIATLNDKERVEIALLNQTIARREEDIENAASTLTQLLKQPPAGCYAPEEARAASKKSLGELAEQQGLSPSFGTIYGAFDDACREYVTAIESVMRPVPEGSLLRKAYDEWMAARRDQQGLEQAFVDAQAKYERAAAAYVKGVAEKEAVGTAVSEGIDKFQQHVEQTRTLLKAVADAGGALGLKFVAEKRKQEIDTLLTATAGGTVDPSLLKTPEVRQAAAVAATSPGLAEAAYALVSSGQTPLVATLLIEKQRQSVLAAAADRRVERMQSRVDLLQQKLYALAQEARLFREIELAHKRGGLVGSALADGTMVKALATSNSPAKAALWLSLMRYVDTIHTHRAREEKLDYMLIALDHDEAVDNSEMAVGLWNSLIATPVNQIAAYHGSGVRAEDVAALVIQALSLGGIAVGVNR
jgi:hypothetical protein